MIQNVTVSHSTDNVKPSSHDLLVLLENENHDNIVKGKLTIGYFRIYTN